MSTWAEFRERCAANVQRIHDTNDDGMYAKLYADDVERLLRMLRCIDEEIFSRGADAAVAFERTK